MPDATVLTPMKITSATTVEAGFHSALIRIKITFVKYAKCPHPSAIQM
jgi:hypothetical protein